MTGCPPPVVADAPHRRPGAVMRRRLAAQLLTHSAARSPEEITRHLLAIQGQDARGARLALRARSVGLTAANVDDVLSNERSLVISWLNRGTLHLVHRDDYPWLHALTNPPLVSGNARRLAQEGVTADQADKGVKVIEKALLSGPMTRSQLRDHLDSADIPTKGQALVHIIARSSISGITIRGPMVGAEHAFALTRDWIGPLPKVDRDRAVGELARRFLQGHGPADDRDLAKWAGIPLGAARLGLVAIATEVEQLAGGLLDLAARKPVHEVPPPRLLGPFDPTLLGWTSRESIVGQYVSLITTNGLFRPFAMVGGRAVGTWSVANQRVTLELLEVVPDVDQRALSEDSADVDRFFGWRQ